MPKLTLFRLSTGFVVVFHHTPIYTLKGIKVISSRTLKYEDTNSRKKNNFPSNCVAVYKPLFKEKEYPETVKARGPRYCVFVFAVTDRLSNSPPRIASRY